MCAQCGAQSARWNRDGSGVVCTRCGLTQVRARTITTFDDIERTHAHVSQHGDPEVPPFSVAAAIDLIFDQSVRDKVYKQMTGRVAREMHDRAREVFDMAGVSHMRNRMEPTQEQRSLMITYIHDYLIGIKFDKAVEMISMFVTSTSNRPWRQRAWYPWMCALFYPEPEVVIIQRELRRYFWRESAESEAKLSDAEKRNEELFSRKKKPSNTDEDSDDGDTEYKPDPYRQETYDVKEEDEDEVAGNDNAPNGKKRALDVSSGYLALLRVIRQKRTRGVPGGNTNR